MRGSSGPQLIAFQTMSTAVINRVVARIRSRGENKAVPSPRRTAMDRKGKGKGSDPRKVQWRINLGALLLGTVATFILLEISLALFTDVDTAWFPGKAFLSLNGGQAICFSPGGTVDLPLNAQREEDREWLIQHTRQWYALGAEMGLAELLTLAPHCVVINEGEREFGLAPNRTQVVPIFGDSYAFGDGLPSELSVAGFLAEQDSWRNFPTLARPGTLLSDVPGQVDRFLRLSRERGWQASEAVILFSIADVLPPQHSPPGLTALTRVERRDGPRRPSASPGLWEKLAARCRTYLAIRQYIDHRRSTADSMRLHRMLYDDAIPDDGRRRTRAILRALNLRLRKRGIQLHVVLCPVFHVVDGSYPFKAQHEVVLGWCAEDGLRCHDAAFAVLGDSDSESLILHPRDRHPNDIANGRLASFLLDHVLRSGEGDGR